MKKNKMDRENKSNRTYTLSHLIMVFAIIIIKKKKKEKREKNVINANKYIMHKSTLINLKL
jgi:hypothetical protein